MDARTDRLRDCQRQTDYRYMDGQRQINREGDDRQKSEGEKRHKYVFIVRTPVKRDMYTQRYAL